MVKKLTTKEEVFVQGFLNYYLTHLKEPTREELATYIGISPQLAQYYYKVVKQKGWLKISRKQQIGNKLKI